MSKRGCWIFILVAFDILSPALAQSQEESLKVYGEHPRLLLGSHRLKLLQKERERHSLRWQQLELLVAGHAPMPEPGFAHALYYRVTQDPSFGKSAVTWAVGPGTDLRQLALVFDWCQDALSPAQSRVLISKLVKGIAQTGAERSVPAVRSRLFAAVTLANHADDVSQRQIEQIIQSWWRGEIAPALRAGRNVVPRDDLYALFELLHVVRDNFNIDLRESAPAFFKTLLIYDLVSFYPATYPAPEGEYRIPATKGGGEPDVRRATMARAAELAMVPYDPNAPESQILQGWLMHDNFLLRGTLGSPYEFFWANPYHPGLSYYLAPLVFHDELFGRLFVRSNWEESARWLGYFDGELQIFERGGVTVLNPELSAEPMTLDTAVILFGKNSQKFRTILNEDEEVFVLGLKPRWTYQIEVDDEEMTEGETDTGGILEIKLPHKVEVGVRLRGMSAAPTRSSKPSPEGNTSGS